MADTEQTVEQKQAGTAEISGDQADSGKEPDTVQEGIAGEDAEFSLEEGAESYHVKEEDTAAGEAEESEPSSGTEGKDPKVKKLFDKKKGKAQAKLEEKIAELEEKRVRQLAEFENFRKRSEKEKSQMFEMGAKDVVEKILPVIDNFERGLMTVPEGQTEDSFVQGMELVYKQMITALEELGVSPIEAVGQPFDPNMHNAVMAVDDDSLESGTVAEELQKGYLYKDSVVRHSMVKVVN